MSKLAGFDDVDLHAQIHEALKVLDRATDTYAVAVQNIEAQYLRALEASHDGDDAACAAVKAQVAAVRALY